MDSRRSRREVPSEVGRVVTRHLGNDLKAATPGHDPAYKEAVLLAVSTILLFLLTAAPAAAHQVILSVHAHGKTIHGRATYGDGGPVADAEILVLDPAGARLGATWTDAEGKFDFEAVRRCDHRFVVHAGSGHGATRTVSAAQLPQTLPADGHAHDHDGHGHTHSTDEAQAVDSAERLRETAQRMAERSLAGELMALHEKVDRLESTIRFRDIVGGVGYIVGLGGVAFYFLGVRRKGEA